MKPSHGYLAKNPEAPSVLAGVAFDGSFPTRREEYGFLHDVLASLPWEDGMLQARGVCLDAGSGYNPSIHVAPAIAANLGFTVEALDTDLRQFALPWHPRIRRTFGSLAATPFPDAFFDVVYSISTLEHCSEETRAYFVFEAFRLLRPGGYLVLTVDDVDATVLAKTFEHVFDVGEEAEAPETFLTPRVAFLVARRLEKPRG